MAKTKEERAAARANRKAAKSGSTTANNSSEQIDTLVKSTEKIKIENNRSATGVLTSQKDSRDIKVCSFYVKD